MQLVIRQIQAQDTPAFHACLDAVAQERRYLAQLQAPPPQRVQEFVAQSVAQDAAQFVALVGPPESPQLVGWCDVFPHWAQAVAHVGTLGMGVQAGFRGQGIGRALMGQTLAHALAKGIYRVTLEARADNLRAIHLYEQMGFRHEARTRCAMRFDGVFHDGVQMALLQGPAA